VYINLTKPKVRLMGKQIDSYIWCMQILNSALLIWLLFHLYIILKLHSIIEYASN